MISTDTNRAMHTGKKITDAFDGKAGNDTLPLCDGSKGYKALQENGICNIDNIKK